MKNIILKLIRIYKKNFSRLGVCRLSPSCSDYAFEAVEKHGVLRGVSKSFLRFLKCNSFFTPVVGTYDPVNS